jgi:uncharacterized paraquat-inducible protein A
MDALGLYDIYGYQHQPFWQTLWFKIGVASVALVMVALLVWWCFTVVRARKKYNYWAQWQKNLETLRTKKMADVVFYATLAALIKECAVVKLHASESLTDLELTLFLKSSDFPATVRSLSELLERASLYKFDPVHTNPGDHRKELEQIDEALQVLKQLEEEKQKKQK